MAIYKLGEISKVRVGKTPSTKIDEYWQNGSTLWYTGKDISGNSHKCETLSSSAIINNKQPLTFENSVLLAMVRYIEPFIPLENSTFNQNVASIESNEDILLRDYLFLWLKQNKDGIKTANISGSTFPRINSSIIKQLLIAVPSISTQQEIIEIIKPIEELLNKLNETRMKLLDIISNLPKDNNELTLGQVGESQKKQPKSTEQISAKVMQSRLPYVKSVEERGTYKSNTYNCDSSTLLINTIRPNLNKFCITPKNLDYNGTSVAIEVENKQTSIMSALLNNDFWNQCVMYSKGTKMPIISRKDLIHSVKFNETFIEIPNLFKILSKTNLLELKLLKLRSDFIKLLLK